MKVSDNIRSLQESINSGLCWQLDAAGREAMRAIDDGLCMVGHEATKDYYGNRVPGRYMLQQGTKGTFEYVKSRRGEAYAKELEAIGEPVSSEAIEYRKQTAA
jgi:hypothetical protein